MPDLNLTYLWRCFATDDSSEWELRYDPTRPDEEQVELKCLGRTVAMMSVETADALAALLRAPGQMSHVAKQP